MKEKTYTVEKCLFEDIIEECLVTLAEEATKNRIPQWGSYDVEKVESVFKITEPPTKDYYISLYAGPIEDKGEFVATVYIHTVADQDTAEVTVSWEEKEEEIKTYEGWSVLNALKTWGWNPGEIEEIVVRLVSDPDNIKGAEAIVYEDHISYSLDLTEKGKDVYYSWCAENGFHPSLKGKLENDFQFVDDNLGSIKNTNFDEEIETSIVEDVFGHLKPKIEARVKDALARAFQSDNWLNVYDLWEHDTQVKHYLEEHYPDIDAICWKVRDVQSELIAAIGEHFHNSPGGIEF